MNKICYNCGKCCFDTEMTLNIDDIEKIERLNRFKYKRGQFCEQEDGFYKLKNIDSHCIFLNPHTLKCKIYRIRPEGCRYYPMIFDQYQNKCVIDNFCPKGDKFYQNHKKFKQLCVSLRRFINNLLSEKSN